MSTSSFHGNISEHVLSGRSPVIVKGISIYTERIGNASKAYFEDTIPKLLQILPESEIENLQSATYCHDKLQTGILRYPVLSKEEKEMTDRTGRFRAYSQQIAGYWVSAQWNEANLKSWKNYLIRILSELA